MYSELEWVLRVAIKWPKGPNSLLAKHLRVSSLNFAFLELTSTRLISATFETIPFPVAICKFWKGAKLRARAGFRHAGVFLKIRARLNISQYFNSASQCSCPVRFRFTMAPVKRNLITPRNKRNNYKRVDAGRPFGPDAARKKSNARRRRAKGASSGSAQLDLFPFNSIATRWNACDDGTKAARGTVVSHF